MQGYIFPRKKESGGGMGVKGRWEEDCHRWRKQSRMTLKDGGRDGRAESLGNKRGQKGGFMG